MISLNLETMNDINLKNKLLKELVNKQSIGGGILLDIFEGDQSELNFIAMEFEKNGYAKLVHTDQGVTNVDILHEGEVLFRNGGF